VSFPFRKLIMRWFRTDQSHRLGDTAPEASSYGLQLEEPNHNTESKNESDDPQHSNWKIILPVVFSLCLAVFLTALVCLSYRSIVTHLLTTVRIRIEPLLESQYLRFLTTSNPSMTLRGTKARICLPLLRYNCQLAKYTYVCLSFCSHVANSRYNRPFFLPNGPSLYSWQYSKSVLSSALQLPIPLCS
jgi:hypothetical protein